MKRLHTHTHRQVCAEAETTQGSSTCCSFVAEACARQAPLFQLFPDVCFLCLPPLDLALLFFHLISDSSSASFSVLCRTHLTEAYVSYISNTSSGLSSGFFIMSHQMSSQNEFLFTASGILKNLHKTRKPQACLLYGTLCLKLSTNVKGSVWDETKVLSLD